MRAATPLVLVLALAAAGSAAAAPAPQFRPIIGRPIAAPAVPTAGEAFRVSFAVTRSDNGQRLTRAAIACDPVVDGALVPHRESFAAGTARVVFTVPDAAEGRTVNVKLVVRAAGRAAQRTVAFRVPTTMLPALSIDDVAAPEGNSGVKRFSFPVALSAPAKRAVSVDFATSDGTAVAGSDYAAGRGTIVFAPGETRKAVVVDVSGDLTQESDETFTVQLASPTNATLARAAATATIVGDELVLGTPAPGTPVVQNRGDIGCPASPTVGYGLSVTFTWTTNGRPDITAFGLVVRHRDATLDLVNASFGADTTSFTYRSCQAFVADPNLSGWYWSVRAVNAAGEMVAAATGVFSFAPCRLADGRGCYAPG